MKTSRPARSMLRALSATAAALVLGGALLGNAAPASAAFHSPGDFNRAQVGLRANAWVRDGVGYSQTSWYNGYRQDCSGFVSMAWGLKKSYVTWTLPQVAWPIHKSDLTLGDIMLNVDDHVVIFDRWANASHTAYWDWELAGSTGRPVHRVVPYPFWTADSWKYKPYRFAVSPDYTGKAPVAAAGQPQMVRAQGAVTQPKAEQPDAGQPNGPARTVKAANQPKTLSPRPSTTKPQRGPSAAPERAGTPAATSPDVPLPTRTLSRRALTYDDQPPAQEQALVALIRKVVAWLAD